MCEGEDFYFDIVVTRNYTSWKLCDCFQKRKKSICCQMTFYRLLGYQVFMYKVIFKNSINNSIFTLFRDVSIKNNEKNKQSKQEQQMKQKQAIWQNLQIFPVLQFLFTNN